MLFKIKRGFLWCDNFASHMCYQNFSFVKDHTITLFWMIYEILMHCYGKMLNRGTGYDYHIIDYMWYVPDYLSLHVATCRIISWWLHGNAFMGPIWGRQDPGGPHELCYLGSNGKASFVVVLNQLFNKQLDCLWFETPWRPWDATVMCNMEELS